MSEKRHIHVPESLKPPHILSLKLTLWMWMDLVSLVLIDELQEFSLSFTYLDNKGNIIFTSNSRVSAPHWYTYKFIQTCVSNMQYSRVNHYSERRSIKTRHFHVSIAANFFFFMLSSFIAEFYIFDTKGHGRVFWDLLDYFYFYTFLWRDKIIFLDTRCKSKSMELIELWNYKTFDPSKHTRLLPPKTTICLIYLRGIDIKHRKCLHLHILERSEFTRG